MHYFGLLASFINMDDPLVQISKILESRVQIQNLFKVTSTGNKVNRRLNGEKN